MELQHEFDCDHDFFTEKSAPERSTGWADGWRVELDRHGDVVIAEFFDAEKNALFDCSVVPNSDLDRMLDEITYERFGVER